MLSYSEIYDAYFYGNSSDMFDNAAYISAAGDKVVLMPDKEFAEPGERKAVERILKKGEWLDLPKSRELDLGKKLIFRFAEQYLTPQEQDFVGGLFSHSGAYRNWRNFLDLKDLTGKWYRFRDAEEEKALKGWLTDNGIAFLDDSTAKPKPDSSGKA